jgi:nitric oxide dioxygenase
MTPDEVALVRESFKRMIARRDEVAAAFYARLFDLAPQVRPMFKGDMREQGRKLMTTVASVVGSLDRFDDIRPSVVDLGVHHAHIGARPEHYGVVGEALLWAMEKELGPALTPETKAAWAKAYAALAAAMIGGATGKAA